MPAPEIRRIVTHRDETLVSDAPNPVRAWAAAVIWVPPGAGDDLEPLTALGEQLGDQLGSAALALLPEGSAEAISYGKGAIVGAGLALELGPAILHPRLGKALRALLGQGKAIIPSSIKRGGPGTRLDVPLHGKDNEWDFSLLDSVEVVVADAPAEREIVAAVALARFGRAHARIGKPAAS
jgi:hypothetical protein